AERGGCSAGEKRSARRGGARDACGDERRDVQSRDGNGVHGRESGVYVSERQRRRGGRGLQLELWDGGAAAERKDEFDAADDPSEREKGRHCECGRASVCERVEDEIRP